MTTDAEQARYEELSRSATEALDTAEEAARNLVTRDVVERSPDGLVAVRVTAGGAVSAVRFRPGALRRAGNTGLAEVLARTLRAAQVRAREEYERALASVVPEEVAEVQRLVREAIRMAPADPE